MARGFSKQELTEIRQQLIDEARNQYRTRGFKTGIKDLTDAIGIAPGSFYKFYTSKEELIFTILEEEEASIKEILFNEFNHMAFTSPNEIACFLIRGVELATGNPFIELMMSPTQMSAISRKVPKERLERHMNHDQLSLEKLLPLQDHPQKKTIGSVIRAFFLLTMHQREIGQDEFQNTLHFYANALAHEILREG
ncbi:TetR/AcrR family transcriptional regulator [Pseudalkalibacillus hwajinpoensis]|uniref:TetR/AcrR family transcriptional regulator n=1 Tax=Guptibacillus hwajinpoensis TaxID=208199 RepID=UPI00325B0478